MTEPITFRLTALAVVALFGAVGAVIGYIGLRMGRELADRIGGPEIELPLPPPPHELLPRLLERRE